MKAKNLLSYIPNRYILNHIVSYFPENISKNRILQIFRYNTKYQKLLNLGLYNYQKEYLSLALKKVNPRNYNISHLHNYFKSKNAFCKEEDKEIFDKIIKELIPEEEDIFEKLNFKKVTNLSVVENLESLEIDITEDNFDLRKLVVPNIKNLKFYSSANHKIVKMPFSLLNDLEALIIYDAKLDIYSIPNEPELELKKLKYLKLILTRVNKKLNIKFSCPNLIYLYFEFVPYYKKLSYFAYYFNLFEEEITENVENEDNTSLCGMADSDIPDYEYNLPQNIIEHFFGKFINLKEFALFRFDDGTSKMTLEKYINGVKVADNFIKSFYRYVNSVD